jgi:hypothetical protein
VEVFCLAPYLLGPGKYQIVQYLSVLSVANMPFKDFLHPSKPEAGAQDGRIGSERRAERETLGYGDPGYFLIKLVNRFESAMPLCVIIAGSRASFLLLPSSISHLPSFGYARLGRDAGY